MGKPVLTDELWELIDLKPPEHLPYGKALPMLPQRQAVGGAFVLRTGVPWEYMPRQMSFGSAMTC